ncbi:MAG: ABC transporter ATP-binding protein [Caldilineaceae bacterium]|nr:ABC transporter ATP-binding protein [Caldilineaceae bacterium]MCY3992882.1 ABC transporter ATP-binding protein [Caldilineaceae bacterium]
MTTTTPEIAQSSSANGSAARAEPLLSLRNLRTWFELRRWGFGRAGTVRAVDDVSFDLHAGEAIAIVGESGCGKSTLMKTILGLHMPTEGSVIFEGRDLSTLDNKEMQWFRSQVGYVQQDPFGALPPFMDIRRILGEPLKIHGNMDESQRQNRIYEVMEEVRLTPVDDILPRFPHMLSGGQQQRVVIARAMLLHPRMIVADEPVSMLDMSVRVEVLRLLQGLQRDHNLAVVYITHDLSTVRYFSERIFVMYAGEIVEQSRMDDLLRNPLHPYTRALIAAIADPDPENAHVFRDVPPGEPPSLVNPPSGCRFHPRCTHFMENLCELETPPDFEPEPQHYARCFLYKD